jgi:hypothetical protein
VLGLEVYAALVLVSFIVNAIRAPVKLDNHRHLRASLLRQSAKQSAARKGDEIHRLNQALAAALAIPTRTPVEEHHYKTAKQALRKLSSGLSLSNY